jgi:lipopolysaccharide transport system ATP-binding protein
VGLNGAGKSTLLRLIGGVGVPDEGSITVKGRIGALLDIGAGLTEDLTGRENIVLMGVIGGMLRSEVAEEMDAIIGFSELQDSIDNPVRTYSTGMKLRLAFAVAVHTRPEVLLIDEVLAVGDLAFQRKCLRRVMEIKESGCTIFLVSHDPSQIEALCDDVLFLRQGSAVTYGPMRETMALYDAMVNAKEEEQEESYVPYSLPWEEGSVLEPNVTRFGSGEILIDAVRLVNSRGQNTNVIASGEMLEVQFDYRPVTPVSQPVAIVGIYAKDDTNCYETNSQLAGIELGEVSREGGIALKIDRLDLAPGHYNVTVGLYSADWEKAYDYHAEIYPLEVLGDGVTKGYLNPPKEWKLRGATVAGTSTS